MIYLFIFAIQMLPADPIHKSEGTIMLNEHLLHYNISCDFIDIQEENGDQSAKIFYTSYTKKDGEAGRPVTFCVNGGPGASSVFLHMGAFGPKRFLTKEEGQKKAPPYIWVDNEETLLQISDLVFIDPVGTGFSHSTNKENPTQYFEVFADIESMEKFIKGYLQKEGKWNHPKYLLGESYGTTRVAGLAQSLHEAGIYLNGCVLISLALDFGTIDSSLYSFLPEMLSLPTYFLTAWHHEKAHAGKTLEEVVNFSRDFVKNTYAPFVISQSYQDEEERNKIAEELEKHSGIAQTIWKKHRLLMPFPFFANTFLDEEAGVLGAYDSTITGNYYPHLNYFATPSAIFAQDPSVSEIQGIFSAGFNAYLQQEVGLLAKTAYREFNITVNENWDYSKFIAKSYSLLDGLETALSINPFMQVFAASGYYDLVTPFSAAEYTLSRMDPRFQKNVTIRNYESGHMIYLKRNAHKELITHLKDFYQQSL